MHITSYLQRIDYEGDLTPSLDTLRRLQWQHLHHVPFENLDIHYQRPIQLDTAALYNKIVLQRRGGFCYELNGLFYQLLSQLGFEVKMISARIYSDSKQKYGAEFDHMALILRFEEGEYLADVGFGKFIFHPMPFVLDQAHHDPGGTFVIRQHDEQYLRIDKLEGENVIPVSLLTPEARKMEDYQEMCLFQQFDPDSHFVKRKMISLPIEGGRLSLTSDSLKITRGQEVEESSIADQAAFEAALWKHFSIKMTD
ncbi:MAG: arylamine N-acetyltransferase [Bacteroidota bacterium]